MNNNIEIRALLKRKKIHMYMVADKMGIHDNTLFRLFRYELSKENKQKVMKAIKQIQEERDNGYE